PGADRAEHVVHVDAAADVEVEPFERIEADLTVDAGLGHRSPGLRVRGERADRVAVGPLPVVVDAADDLDLIDDLHEVLEIGLQAATVEPAVGIEGERILYAGIVEIVPRDRAVVHPDDGLPATIEV